MTGPATRATPRTAAPAPASLGRQLAALVFDIAAPIGLYYGLRAAGLSSLLALAAGAVIPAASAAWTLARQRRANMIALLVLGTIVVSLVISVISASPRFLLAKDGLLTGVWGIWFLASVWARRRPRSCSPGRCWRGGARSRSGTGTRCGTPSRGSAASGGRPR